MIITEPLIPAAPIAQSIDPVRELWVMGVMGLAAGVTLLRGMMEWRSSGRPIALAMFIAGGFAVVHEPMVDLLGGCWHYANARIAFVGYGRPMPVWLCIAYFFYVGIGLSVLWGSMRGGLDRRQLWLWYGGSMLGDVIMECTLLNLNIYTYYGNQPLVFLKFPLWWAPVNGGYIFATAALVHRLDPLLYGWRTLVVIPLTLTVSAAFNAATAWPAWYVINSRVGALATESAGILTILLSFLAVWFVVEIVAVDRRSMALPRELNISH